MVGVAGEDGSVTLLGVKKKVAVWVGCCCGSLGSKVGVVCKARFTLGLC